MPKLPEEPKVVDAVGEPPKVPKTVKKEAAPKPVEPVEPKREPVTIELKQIEDAGVVETPAVEVKPKKKGLPSENLPPRGKRGETENDAVKPDREIPSKDRTNPRSKMEPFVGARRSQPNAAGLVRTDADRCFNLSTWKGGVCVVQGNRPCPYLGGAQKSCELYKEPRNA